MRKAAKSPCKEDAPPLLDAPPLPVAPSGAVTAPTLELVHTLMQELGQGQLPPEQCSDTLRQAPRIHQAHPLVTAKAISEYKGKTTVSDCWQWILHKLHCPVLEHARRASALLPNFRWPEGHGWRSRIHENAIPPASSRVVASFLNCMARPYKEGGLNLEQAICELLGLEPPPTDPPSKKARTVVDWDDLLRRTLAKREQNREEYTFKPLLQQHLLVKSARKKGVKLTRKEKAERAMEQRDFDEMKALLKKRRGLDEDAYYRALVQEEEAAAVTHDDESEDLDREEDDDEGSDVQDSYLQDSYPQAALETRRPPNDVLFPDSDSEAGEEAAGEEGGEEVVDPQGYCSEEGEGQTDILQ